MRAAQGRDDEAERLLREAEEILRPTGFRRHQIAPLEALAEFLRARDRDDEAAEVEEALASCSSSAGAAGIIAADAGAGARPAPQARARIALIAWLDASSGDSEITVAGRSNRSSASRSGSARSVPSP